MKQLLMGVLLLAAGAACAQYPSYSAKQEASTGKWGVYQHEQEYTKSRYIIDPQYDSVRQIDYKGSRFLLVKNGKYGISDGRKVVMKPMYDHIDTYTHVVQKDGRYGIIRFGQELLPLAYDGIEAATLHCNPARPEYGYHAPQTYIINSQGRWGVVQITAPFNEPVEKKEILPPVYERIGKGERNGFFARQGGRWKVLYYPGCGQPVESSFTADSIRHLSGLHFIAQEKGRWALGFKERLLTGYDYDGIDTTGIYIRLEKGGLYDLVVTDGPTGAIAKTIVRGASRVRAAGHNQDFLVSATIGGDDYTLDRSGAILSKGIAVAGGEHLAGYRLVNDGRLYGLRDAGGAEVVPIRYRRIVAEGGGIFSLYDAGPQRVGVVNAATKTLVSDSALQHRGAYWVATGGPVLRLYDAALGAVRLPFAVSAVSAATAEGLFVRDGAGTWHPVGAPAETTPPDKVVLASTLAGPGLTRLDRADGKTLIVLGSQTRVYDSVYQLSSLYPASSRDTLLAFAGWRGNVVDVYWKDHVYRQEVNPYSGAISYRLDYSTSRFFSVTLEPGEHIRQVFIRIYGEPLAILQKGDRYGLYDARRLVRVKPVCTSARVQDTEGVVVLAGHELIVQGAAADGTLLLAEACATCKGRGRLPGATSTRQLAGTWVPEKTYTTSAPTVMDTYGVGADGKIRRGYQTRTVTTGGYYEGGRTVKVQEEGPVCTSCKGQKQHHYQGRWNGREYELKIAAPL